MKFTDLFIRRPVAATVVSVLVLVLGLRAMGMLPIQQYPHAESATVTIFTTYYGADPAIMAGFITTPLENVIAQADGIDYMTSKSISGLSQITVNLRLNYDSSRALTEINAKVNSVLDQLPSGTQQPILSVQAGTTIDAMFIAFSSDVMKPNQITDYLTRSVQPRMQSVLGVQQAEVLGAKNFSMRAWLNPEKIAAYNMTAGDVSSALAANDYIAGLGMTKGQMVQVTLNASTALQTVEQFRNLVVKSDGNTVTRLQDVATVTLGSDDYDSDVAFNGKQSVLIGIKVAPTANLLDAVAGVRKIFPGIVAQFPQGMEGVIVYDSTKFVQSSIQEVIRTLFEAVVIVTLVVFVFLGSPRSTLVPIVTIPLSLVGTFGVMLVLGFSMNLLTLLALVLAIGLVVDDAIVVVENVNRRLSDGLTPMNAALEAARELAGPIIAMTIVLIAVYVPIGFQSGLTGALFTEFAFTLAGAVVISGVVALTLSPMMCSKLLHRPETSGRSWEARLGRFVDRAFDRLRQAYARRLHSSLNYLPVTVVFALCVLTSIYFLYGTTRQELAPQEDQGIILALANAAPNATLQQRQLYAPQLHDIFWGHPQTEYDFLTDVPGQTMAGMVLKPWDERTVTTSELQPILQEQVNRIAGLQAVTFQLPSLPGATGLPIQFVINSTGPFGPLNEVSQAFLQEALGSGLFAFLNSDLRIDQPQSTIVIDRDKTALLGLKMSDVGGALAAALGGGYVNYFNHQGRSYKVIPQVEQKARLNDSQLLDYYIRTANGSTVPLGTVGHIETSAIPESLNHFQQQNSATIQGVAMPDVSQEQALTYLRRLSDRMLPSGFSVDYAGPSRQFIQESGGFALTFGFALVIIFLALSALFESFRDPVIILLSVPMSIGGALLAISILGTMGIPGASMNIYTEVGLVTLMGLISKHGILIVEVANTLQQQGKSKREAIQMAAEIRLRPVLMTTAAMVLGVAPLVVATGTGAVARFSMGMVISSGLSIGTLFTLFVVPSFYLMLAADHSRRHEATPAAV